MTPSFYKDAQNMWRWNVKADNGNIVADSSEGYVNLDDCYLELLNVLKLDSRRVLDARNQFSKLGKSS